MPVCAPQPTRCEHLTVHTCCSPRKKPRGGAGHGTAWWSFHPFGHGAQIPHACLCSPDGDSEHVRMLRSRTYPGSPHGCHRTGPSSPPRGAVTALAESRLSELISTAEEMSPSKTQTTSWTGHMLETARPPKDVGLSSQHDKMRISQQARVAPLWQLTGRGGGGRVGLMQDDTSV